MIILLSPAKTLDFDSHLPDVTTTEPDFVDESFTLIKKLRSLSKRKVSNLMNLNKDLTELNVLRYNEWEPDFSPSESRPAILTFNGEVYRGLNASSFSQDDLAYAQDHLRILSGLHGLLRPLDRIRPYRLEMGTNLPVRRRKNLYHFWEDRVTKALNEALEEQEHKVVINLASNEYSKAVNFKKLKAKVVTPVFKDWKNGEFKSIMTYAKHARGKMASHIIKNRIEHPEDLKGYPEYDFTPNLSSESEWVFTRTTTN